MCPLKSRRFDVYFNYFFSSFVSFRRVECNNIGRQRADDGTKVAKRKKGKKTCSNFDTQRHAEQLLLWDNDTVFDYNRNQPVYIFS